MISLSIGPKVCPPSRSPCPKHENDRIDGLEWDQIALSEATDPGMDPITMNEKNLYTFVRALGTDLEQLQGLSMSQMISVSYWLMCAGFVKSFVVQGSSHEIFQAEPDRTSIADSFPSTPFSP
ncbi:serine-proline rich protein [Penicillium angulare]|uniref:serine-proline rich protein n=1 Tax=Penicillium angulare TaxID=116970 RepID=UPI002540CD7D|nr:serine-proline rich protein [Penicillium angulare]KAJ5259343.1 serine-proline rich protein [Penicillium angulare]